MDPISWLGGNPLLLATHARLIASWERVARLRYLAAACREIGDWEGEHDLLERAAHEARNANWHHLVLSEVSAARFSVGGQLLWPNPRIRSVDEQLDGVTVSNYYESMWHDQPKAGGAGEET